ncbi:MAG: alpha/beta hydrolase family protein [Rhodospirillales bacterium]|jgi:dipeptidyl aminopeptidase/acylaminoacyl peptidase
MSNGIQIDPNDEAPSSRRWIDQRWVLDNVISSVGIDWDQPRSLYFNGACGIESNPDFASIRQGVKKFADIGPAFEAAARRRQAKAIAAEDAGELVTARDNYFMAAIQWGAAQWPHNAVNATNVNCNKNKRECYTSYARLAAHKVEEVWIPFGGSKIPAWFHLPPDYKGGKLPLVVSFPGLDTFKEIFVSLSNDRWLSRGMAVLAVDGPGQSESRILGHKFSLAGFIELAPKLLDWAIARPEIDKDRIGIFGNSLGSLICTAITANEPRLKACAVSSICFEPGQKTMVEAASPTYKRRLMYISGYTEEAKFDEFRRSLTWEGYAEKIRVPYIALAGEHEELCPLENADRMFASMSCPRQFVLYQESRHAVGYVPSANLGPYPTTLVADWMAARLAGKPITSERWYVHKDGKVTKTPI